MAMTLRLDEGLDDQVQTLADAQGLSKHQLVVLATRQYVEREHRIARTLRTVDRVVDENRGLLDRLAR